MAGKLRKGKVPTLQTIRRAVASSTAIETGKSVRALEKQLAHKNPKFDKLALAK